MRRMLQQIVDKSFFEEQKYIFAKGLRITYCIKLKPQIHPRDH